MLQPPQTPTHDGPPRANESRVTEPERKIRARDRQNPSSGEIPLHMLLHVPENPWHRLRQKRPLICRHNIYWL